MCIILSSSERTAWGKAHMLSVLWRFDPGIGCDEGSWDGELPWIICVHAQSRPTLQWLHGLEPARLLCPWDFPGKNTGVGCQYFLLQEIFRTQGLNLHLLCLLHWYYFTSFATWEACIICSYILFLLLSSNSLPIDNGDHHLPPCSHHTSRSPYRGKASHDSCFHSTAQKPLSFNELPPRHYAEIIFPGDRDRCGVLIWLNCLLF